MEVILPHTVAGSKGVEWVGGGGGGGGGLWGLQMCLAFKKGISRSLQEISLDIGRALYSVILVGNKTVRHPLKKTVRHPLKRQFGTCNMYILCIFYLVLSLHILCVFHHFQCF